MGAERPDDAGTAPDVRLELTHGPDGPGVLADGRALTVPPHASATDVGLAAARRHAARSGRDLLVEVVDGTSVTTVSVGPQGFVTLVSAPSRPAAPATTASAPFVTEWIEEPRTDGEARPPVLPSPRTATTPPVGRLVPDLPSPRRATTPPIDDPSPWARPVTARTTTGRPVASLVVTALVATAVLVGAVGTGVATLASSQALPGSCRPVTVYSVGGEGGASDVLRGVTDPLTSQFGEKISVVTVPPPPTGGSYASAESDAVSSLANAVGEHVDGCPTGALMLFGYSQGAQVAGDLASRVGTGLEPRIPANLVSAVGLFGDPARSPRTRAVPDGTTGQGALPPRAVGFGSLDARTIEICAPGDPVCDSPPNAAAPALEQALASPVHGSYQQLPVAAGTTAPQWAAASLGKVVAAIPTDAGPAKAPAGTTAQSGGAAPTSSGSGSGETTAAPGSGSTAGGSTAGATVTAAPGSSSDGAGAGAGAATRRSGSTGASSTAAPGDGGSSGSASGTSSGGSSGTATGGQGSADTGYGDAGAAGTGSAGTGTGSTGAEATGVDPTSTTAPGAGSAGGAVSTGGGSTGAGPTGTVSDGQGSAGTGYGGTGSAGSGSTGAGPTGTVSDGQGSAGTGYEGTGSAGSGSTGAGPTGTATDGQGSVGADSTGTGSAGTGSTATRAPSSSSSASGSGEYGSEGGSSASSTAPSATSTATPSASGRSSSTTTSSTASRGAGSDDSSSGGATGTATGAAWSLASGLEGFKSTPWNNQNATDPSAAASPNVPGREAVKFEMPGGGKRTEAEPDVPEFQDGQKAFVGYSGFFDKGFPTNTDTWQLIMQFKQPGTGSPPLAVEVGKGQLRLANNGGNEKDFCPVTEGAFSFQLGVTFGGAIDAWCNGKQTLTGYTTPQSNVQGSAYLKTGIYRDESIKQDSRLFLNDLKVGKTLDQVSGLAGASSGSGTATDAAAGATSGTTSTPDAGSATGAAAAPASAATGTGSTGGSTGYAAPATAQVGSGSGSAGGQKVCDKFGSTDIAGGRFMVQNNEWGASDGQCVTATTQGFTVDSGNHAKNDAPASYPSIMSGCWMGTCTQGTTLPMRISDLGPISSDIAGTIPAGTKSNLAYDVWADSTPRKNGHNDAMEMMIWLKATGGIQPIGQKSGTATVGGATWDVWKGTNGGVNVISYVRQAPVDRADGLPITDFVKNAVTQGSVQATDFVTNIQAGFEPWTGGPGMALSRFAVDYGAVTPAR